MRTLVVAKRLIKQIIADKRSIGLMFVAPIFVIFLLNIILTSSTSKPIIDIISAPKPFIEQLSENAEVKEVSEQVAIDNLKNGKSNAYVIFERKSPKITLEGSSPSINGLVMGVIQKTMSKNIIMNQGKSQDMPQSDSQSSIEPEISYLYGSKNMGTFDSLAPLFMGFFIFFFVFLLAGVAFLRERISGTLERVLATPLKRRQIVWGYFWGFGLFVVLQTIVIQLFIIYGLDVSMKGNFWYVLIVNLILAGQSLALGTLLSTFARNEFQLFQFIPVVIVPQILFSGIFDLSDAPAWVTMLSKIFPLTYGAEALKSIMIKGKGLLDIQFDIYILIGYTLLFLILNSLALKKYRKA